MPCLMKGALHGRCEWSSAGWHVACSESWRVRERLSGLFPRSRISSCMRIQRGRTSAGGRRVAPICCRTDAEPRRLDMATGGGSQVTTPHENDRAAHKIGRCNVQGDAPPPYRARPRRPLRTTCKEKECEHKYGCVLLLHACWKNQLGCERPKHHLVVQLGITNCCHLLPHVLEDGCVLLLHACWRNQLGCAWPKHHLVVHLGITNFCHLLPHVLEAWRCSYQSCKLMKWQSSVNILKKFNPPQQLMLSVLHLQSLRDVKVTLSRGTGWKSRLHHSAQRWHAEATLVPLARSPNPCVDLAACQHQSWCEAATG